MYTSIDKRNEAVMEITSHREPGGKYPKQKKVYIGKRDKEGKFIPNKYCIERTKKEELESKVAELQAQLDSTSTEAKKKGKEVKVVFDTVKIPKMIVGNSLV